MDRGSVSAWLGQLRDGDDDAAQRIFERYVDDLLRVARSRLQGAFRRESDEEDVVLSAFYSFFEGANAGQFPRLGDRYDLWRLLLLITVRKVDATKRRAMAQKRSPQPGDRRAAGDLVNELSEIVSHEPTPDLILIAAEEYHRLVDATPDDIGKQIIELKLSGYRHSEIARKLDVSERTIERKLERIRSVWQKEVGES